MQSIHFVKYNKMIMNYFLFVNEKVHSKKENITYNLTSFTNDSMEYNQML